MEAVARAAWPPCAIPIIKVMHLHISLIIKNNRPPIYFGSSLEEQLGIYTERCVKPAVKVMLAMHATLVVNKIADSNAAAKSVPKEKINKIHTYIIIYCIAGPVERIADLSQLRSTNICIMKQGTTK